MGEGYSAAGGSITDPFVHGGGGAEKRNVKATTKQFKQLTLPSTPYGKFKDVDEMEKELVSKLTPAEQHSTLFNLLIVLDDVVGDIKANENNPAQTALIFNRRHILANGTVSIIIVSQKYTMIPARIRSCASWLILFRLNPVDFENVYKDVVMVSTEKWDQVLNYVYDINNTDEGLGDSKSKKTYNHLDIFVEYDIFFKNFIKLSFK